MLASLLYSRRISFGADPKPGPDPCSNLYQPRRAQGQRHHDGHGSSSSRSRTSGDGSPRARHCSHSHHSESEHFRVGRAATGRYDIPNRSNGCTVNARISSRLRLISDEQLPPAVLQARSRVIQRLRSASLLASLETTLSPETSDSEYVHGEFHPTNSGEVHPFQEVRASWCDYGLASTRHAEVLNVRKPPALSCKALCCLQLEVFREAEQTEMTMREVLECCICLERFQEGDKLSKLRCGHKFHQCCLEPWVRTCGDCPYCRAFVVVE